MSATDHRDRAAQGTNFRKHSWNFTQYTKVPTDNLDEWFFICATYDPTIDEIGSFARDTLSNNDMPGYWQPYGLIPHSGARGGLSMTEQEEQTIVDTLGWQNVRRDEQYWLNHKDHNGTMDSRVIVSKSNFGNRCKVEIISKSDLLRARGYKVD